MTKPNLILDHSIEAAWDGHKADCKHCSQYVEGKSATLAYICPQGAPLIKQLLELQARPALAAKRKAVRVMAKQNMPQLIDGSMAKASREKLKSVTRYKESA